MYKIELGGAALLLLAVAVYIVYKQRRASSCPAHNRWAGHVAMALAAVAALAGTGLLIYVWLWT